MNGYRAICVIVDMKLYQERDLVTMMSFLAMTSPIATFLGCTFFSTFAIPKRIFQNHVQKCYLTLRQIVNFSPSGLWNFNYHLTLQIGLRSVVTLPFTRHHNITPNPVIQLLVSYLLFLDDVI
jgi:hypothetical protein